MAQEIKKRLRLYGKPATQEEIAKEVSKLLLGDLRRQIMPKNITEIGRAMAYSRDTVYYYKNLAIDLKFLELDQDGKAKIPEKIAHTAFKKFTEDNRLSKNMLVSDWVQDMMTRKQGKPIVSWKSRLQNFTVWLNTLKINPEQALDSLETTDKYMKNFLSLYSQGKAEMIYKQDPSKTDISGIAYRYSQAYRDFMNFHKLVYPKGHKGVSSQVVVGHAKYNDVKLTDEELAEAKKYLIKKYGVCSDEFRFFMMGVESCGRHGAVFPMTLDYEIKKFEDLECYVFEVIETKTEGSKHGSKWKKFVTDEDLKKSIDDLKAKGINRLNEEKMPAYKLDRKISTAFYDLYRHLGKETVHDGYFMKHFFHALTLFPRFETRWSSLLVKKNRI